MPSSEFLDGSHLPGMGTQPVPIFVHGATDAVRPGSFEFSFLHLLGTGILDNLNFEGFSGLNGNKFGYGSCFLADNPGRGQRNTPAGVGVSSLYAVQVIVGFAPFVNPLSR